MISQRKYFFLSLLLIAGIALITVVHYFFFMEEYREAPIGLRTPQEYNAYLAKYHKFDSVILGSSISMCFRCTDFDRVCHGFSYKLTIAGCEVPVWTGIARYVCRYQNIKAVLADLHETLLFLPAENTGFLDEYYTDRNLLTDIRAGASLKTIRERRLFYWNKYVAHRRQKEEPFSRDDLYDWSKEYPCGKFVYARNIVRHPVTPDPRRKLSLVQQNLEPLTEFIREHPDIRFYLYLPPYSVLTYDNKEQFLYARKTAMDMLLPLPNVELYDFQAAECVTDFNQYKDPTHFSPDISAWILQQMQEKKYLVSAENRKEFEKKFAETVLNFDQEKAKKELHEYYLAHAAEKKKK